MKQIKYSDAAFALRLEMDPAWDIEAITAVTIGFDTTGGSELLAATSATIYTATTLNAAIARGDMTVVLAVGATALNPGDRFRIAKSNAGPAEDLICHSYDTSTRTVTFQKRALQAHSSGAAVYGMFATYSADFSTVATFTKGLAFRIVWTPNSDDNAVTELAQIAGAAAYTSNFWQVFQNVYPDEYEIINERDMEVFRRYLEDGFQAYFAANGMDINRIVDQGILDHGRILWARYKIAGGSAKPFGMSVSPTYEIAKAEWTEWFLSIRDNRTLWIDEDQDDTIDADEGELQTHTWQIMSRSIA